MMESLMACGRGLTIPQGKEHKAALGRDLRFEEILFLDPAHRDAAQALLAAGRVLSWRQAKKGGELTRARFSAWSASAIRTASRLNASFSYRVRRNNRKRPAGVSRVQLRERKRELQGRYSLPNRNTAPAIPRSSAGFLTRGEAALAFGALD